MRPRCVMLTIAMLSIVMVGGLVAVSGCSGGRASSPSGAITGRLVLTGSSTVAPLAAEIALRFEEEHPSVRIDVQSGGSSRGIADVRAGIADIGMASRALARDESDLDSIAIARDGIAIVVHRDNPVAALTNEQIVSVFTGAVTRWKPLNHEDARIVVVNKAAGRATLAVFLDYFAIEPERVAASVIVGENQQAIKTVAGNRHAIGYVSIGAADAAVASGVAIRALPTGGVPPEPAYVADGSFPLVRPLNLLTRRDSSALVRAFLDFARSDRVHDLVVAQSFVPIAVP